MKSYIHVFSELYRALAKDTCAHYPTIQSDMERDLSRLHRALSNEGLSFITITHLDQCNFFQKSLALGTLVHDLAFNPRPRGFGSKSSNDQRPSYLWGLMSLIFQEDGTLVPDPDVNAIAFVRQWLLMAKKLEIDCDESRKETTLTEYLSIDRSLPDHHDSTWDLDDPTWVRREGHPLWGCNKPSQPSLPGLLEGSAEVEVDWVLYRRVADRIRSEIGSFDPWSARPKHGKGAVADLGRALKYDFKNWPRKLQQYFPWDYHASSDFGLSQLELGLDPSGIEFPSVVLCVPKTQKGPRIICKEPIAHQWMQGAVERFLTERVRRTHLSKSINFQDQKLSQAMALEASLNGDVATVDLSNASDRISTRLVEYLFSNSSDTTVLDALHATRSRYFSLNGELHRFRKFAPAGSACTFPVQSILFLSFAVTAILQSRNLKDSDWLAVLPLTRIFGDDIIIPVDSIRILYSALSSCGLKVNVGKSYSTGFFREACGMDAYAGLDVTPAYVRRIYNSSRPSSLQAVVDCSNNLFVRGFWHTAQALVKTVPVAEYKLLAYRPPRDDDYFVKREGSAKGDGAVSLASFSGEGREHLSSRFNSHLHKTEHACIMVKSKTTKTQSDGTAGLIQFFNEEPDPLSNYSSGQVQRVSLKKKRGWV